MAFDPSVSASASLADPPGSSVVLAAVSWIEGTLLGTVATSVAILAIASVGFMMLAGRVNVRRGLTAVMGCFLLFGASAIAAGLLGSVGGEEQAEIPHVAEAPAPTITLPPPPPAGSDPYAGAAVPAK